MLHKPHNYDRTSFGHEVIKIDANSKEKYSLRQRQRGRNQGENNVTNFSQRRSKLNKSCLEISSATWSKSKAKAAPLSKYRRKTANARERSRMREINQAFESLRQCVPPSIAGEDIGLNNEKLTKITTLRLAMKYIHQLTEALTDPNLNIDFLMETTQVNDEIVVSKSTISKQVASAREIKLNATKGLHKRQKQYWKSKTSSRIPSNNAKNNEHSYLSFSPNTVTKSLSSSFFDSDGESLHLSETCLSPVNDISDNSKMLLNGHRTLNQNALSRITWNDCSDTSTLRNPLEISFCFLNQANETLDWEDVQHRTTCSSPFPALDLFSSFNELLHLDPMDHNSLDLFLT